MRSVGFVLAVSATAIVGSSCDTTQPPTAGPATASVQFDARANVEIYDCYDQWRDTSTPLDGQPDVFEDVVCSRAPGTDLENRAVPWRYSVRLVILRAGSTTLEIKADANDSDHDDDVLEPTPLFGNVTPFDRQASSAPLRPAEPPLYFLNPRRVSQGSADYLTFRNIALPVPNVLGTTGATPSDPPRFDVELGAGDALVVEAAKQLIVQGPPIFPGPINPGEPPPDPRLTISGRLFLAGSQITPSNGTVQSTDDDGAGFAFNYISD